MYQENVVLCGASAYEQKYYFNKDFDSLPDHVKKELQIMCVLFTEEIGGIFTLEFDDHGNLQFKTEATEADGFYDDIEIITGIGQNGSLRLRMGELSDLGINGINGYGLYCDNVLLKGKIIVKDPSGEYLMKRKV